MSVAESIFPPNVSVRNSPHTNTARPILLVDTGAWEGHRPNYYKTVLQIFCEQNIPVYALTSNTVAVTAFKETNHYTNCTVLDNSLAIWQKMVLKCLQSIETNQSKKAYFQLASIKPLMIVRFVQQKYRLEEALVFFSSLSDVLPKIPISLRSYFFPKQWTGIYVTPWYDTGNIFLQQDKKLRAYGDLSMGLDSCKQVFVIHPLYKKFFNRFVQKSCFQAIPEPINLKVNSNFEKAKELQKKAKGRFILTCLGSIGKKRNLITILEALKQLGFDRYFLAIIGKLQQSDYTAEEWNWIQIFLRQNKNHLFLSLDGFVTVEENFNALIAASDLIDTHYQNHPFSSNQLLKAIALGKPALVNQGGLMETIMKENEWSVIVENDAKKMAEAIESIKNNFTVSKDKHQAFLQELSYTTLQSRMLTTLGYSIQNNKY